MWRPVGQAIRIAAACTCLTPAFGGVIQVSIGSGQPFDNWPTLGGTFYTGTNTACGVGGACSESTTFSLSQSGISISGTVQFTTEDSAGATQMAVLSVSGLTVDNTGVSGTEPVAITFLSDEFDPTASQPIGVGYAGYMGSDLGPGNQVDAAVQGGANWETGGFTGNFPGAIAFLGSQEIAANVAGPVSFAVAAFTSPVSGATQLIATLSLEVDQPDSELVLPGNSAFVVETGADGLLTPEPGAAGMVGLALAALGARLRRGRRNR